MQIKLRLKLSKWLEAMPRRRNSQRAKEKRRLELTKLIETSVSLMKATKS